MLDINVKDVSLVLEGEHLEQYLKWASWTLFWMKAS